MQMTKPGTNHKKSVSLTPFLLCCGSVLWLACSEENQYQPSPPPSVTVANPIVQDVTMFIEETGQTEAVEQSTVSARVQGILEEIRFAPDDLVQEGDILYVIEQRQYIASRDAARAALAAAQSELSAAQAATGMAQARISAADAAVNVAQADFTRLDGLLKNNAIARSEWELSKANLETANASKESALANQSVVAADQEKAQAKVQQAQADLQQAEINLEYTEVRAPISGRITRTLVKRGNLVNDGTELTTVVKNDPIWANFNISERFLLTMERQSGKGTDEKPDLSQIKAELKRAVDTDFPFKGHLDYYDPAVDQSTGTLAMRAVFSNNDPQRMLLPGLFVRVRIPVSTIEDAVLIPEQAISRDQIGAFVLVVDSDNVVNRRNVTTGTKQGELIVVEQGLSADDRVIVSGIQRARVGDPVEPKQTTLTAEAPISPAGNAEPENGG